jgi:predicted DNA-binding protein
MEVRMPDMEDMERELAAELEASRDDPEEWDSERVEIDVQPGRSQVVSFRLPLEELERLSAIAGATGESLSEFIRGAVELRIRHTIEPSVYLTHTAYQLTLRQSPMSSGRNESDPFYVSDLGKFANTG